MSKQLGKVVIGGGSGFVGSSIQKALSNRGYETVVVSRRIGPGTISWTEVQINGLPEGTKAVINVAGQNVLNPMRRWTTGFKQNVYASRVHTTNYLADAIMSSKVKPKVFLSISGVGYYPPSTTAEYDENSTGGDFDFLSRLCTDWEGANHFHPTVGVRSVKIRSGVVLGRQGGMIKQLFVPFFFGLGGPVGNGSQYLPWIHLDDLTNLFIYAIENDNVTGVVNGVSPHLITNKEFSKAFAKALWRPSLIPMPVFALNLLFSRERAKIMVEGQKVVPRKALDLGFKFKYDTIEKACKTCAHIIHIEGEKE